MRECSQCFPCLLDRIADGDIGAATWLCSECRLSWVHHLACCGSAYQVMYAFRLGDNAVEESVGRTNPHVIGRLSEGFLQAATTTSPLMLACALGQTRVAEVLLKASERVAWVL